MTDQHEHTWRFHGAVRLDWYVYFCATCGAGSLRIGPEHAPSTAGINPQPADAMAQ